jgi:Domain of unknown function (DUF4136)
MMRKVVLIALSFALTPGSAQAEKIKSEFDKEASFSKFKTYAFKPGLLMAAQDHDRLDTHIVNTMRNELNAKGMTEAKENPDVFVTYFGTLGALQAESSLYAPGQMARYDWGIPQGWSGILSTTAVQGSLLIEVVNASTNQLAWRAIVQDRVKNLGNPEKQEQKLSEILSKVFRQYPPKGKT